MANYASLENPRWRTAVISNYLNNSAADCSISLKLWLVTHNTMVPKGWSRWNQSKIPPPGGIVLILFWGHVSAAD